MGTISFVSEMVQAFRKERFTVILGSYPAQDI